VAGRTTAPGQRLHSPYANQLDVAEHISKSKPQIVAFFAFPRQQGGCRARAAGTRDPVKYWEIIADRLHAKGWSYGIAEHLTKRGLVFCVDAHRDGKRFIVKADDLLTAFLSLERDAIAPKGANGNATR